MDNVGNRPKRLEFYTASPNLAAVDLEKPQLPLHKKKPELRQESETFMHTQVLTEDLANEDLEQSIHAAETCVENVVKKPRTPLPEPANEPLIQKLPDDGPTLQDLSRNYLKPISRTMQHANTLKTFKTRKVSLTGAYLAENAPRATTPQYGNFFARKSSVR